MLTKVKNVSLNSGKRKRSRGSNPICKVCGEIIKTGDYGIAIKVPKKTAWHFHLLCSIEVSIAMKKHYLYWT